jgi:hypothetical protein
MSRYLVQFSVATEIPKPVRQPNDGLRDRFEIPVKLGIPGLGLHPSNGATGQKVLNTHAVVEDHHHGVDQVAVSRVFERNVERFADSRTGNSPHVFVQPLFSSRGIRKGNPAPPPCVAKTGVVNSGGNVDRFSSLALEQFSRKCSSLAFLGRRCREQERKLVRIFETLLAPAQKARDLYR